MEKYCTKMSDQIGHSDILENSRIRVNRYLVHLVIGKTPALNREISCIAGNFLGLYIECQAMNAVAIDHAESPGSATSLDGLIVEMEYGHFEMMMQTIHTQMATSQFPCFLGSHRKPLGMPR